MFARPRSAPPLWLIVAALVLTAQAPPGWVTVRATRQAPVLTGFASVRPGAATTIGALQPGILTDLAVAPGEAVRPHQIVARLGGPPVAAMLTRLQGADQAAHATLAAERSKFRDHLSTRAAVAQAAAAAAAARADLAAARDATLLRSPVAGQVLRLDAGPGTPLRPGQAVVTIRPAAGAWVRAVLYGTRGAALLPGTAARFLPADGAPPQPITLRGPLGPQADGGLVLAFSGHDLPPGEAGSVTLSLPSRPVLLVPSTALVLDAGHWWVMRHDATGDHPVRVVPGATAGAETPILAGLAAGDRVIVRDAALLYHRGIAALYQPPD